MKRLKERLRHSHRLRAAAYKLLKACDRLSFYNKIYRSRINKKSASLSSFPAELSIETINLCNARCTICAHPQMKRPKGKMAPSLVRSLIDQAREGQVTRLFLSGYGEPLLDKRLPEFIAYARDRELADICIVTNGYLLDPSTAAELIEAGLNTIVISMDGFSAETYERVRVGLEFARLNDNIMNLPAVRGRSKIKIMISCLDLVSNRQERGEAAERFGKYVDGIYYRQAQGWTSDYARQIAGWSPHYEQNTIPCRYLWDSLSVYIDGTVPACCLDFEAVSNMGDAARQSIADIWTGERLGYYRKSHLENKKADVVPCRHCGYYSVWW